MPRLGHTAIVATAILGLFGIVAIGALVGSLHFRGVSLGAAGVFFAAIVLGHFEWEIPHEFTELGLILFVYAVGLQAGPRFVGNLRSSGAAFLSVGVGSTLLGALVAAGLALWLGMPAHLAAGLYCGATTCTPALAATLDAVRRVTPDAVQATSVAYGAAYPFSVAAVVLTVQLLPRLLRRPAAGVAAQYRAQEAAKTPPLDECALRVTNPNCAGRTIGEVQALQVSHAVICRVKHHGVVGPALPETELHLGDAVLAVGTPNELAKLEALLGQVVVEEMLDTASKTTSEQLLVSRWEVVGKSIRELCIWQRFGVVITHLRRQGLEITPRGAVRLEPGDVLRVVGERDGIDRLAATIGREERRLNETSMVPFAAGIALGALVGQITIPLPGGLSTQIGLGGGVFLVGLLLGHLGTMGPVRIYVPNAAKHFARELGLVIFLAGAGAGAGRRLFVTLQDSGLELVLAGAVVTLCTVIAAVLIMLLLWRWNLLYATGSLSACMTNPPGLAAANNLAPDSDAAANGFAAVYPMALIAKTILAPLIFLVLEHLTRT